MSKLFLWKMDDQLDGRLKKGQLHDAAGFDPDILSEWIRTGAAEWAKPDRKNKDSEA